MRTIRLQTTLANQRRRYGRAMQSPVTFLYVCRGLFGCAFCWWGRAEPLRAGERGTGWLTAFHVIPAYRHTIEVIEIDRRRARRSGPTSTAGCCAAWNHTLRVEPVDAQTCRYSDTVKIDAGMLTAVVAALAVGIFRYRQRRWHKLVRLQLLPQGPAYAS